MTTTLNILIGVMALALLVQVNMFIYFEKRVVKYGRKNS